MPLPSRCASPVFLLASVLLVSACDPAETATTTGGSVTPHPASTSATLTPSLGRVSNAAVEVRCLATGNVLGSGSLASSGSASLTLRGTCSGPVLAEVLANGSTTYFDEKLASTTAFPSGVSLRAIVPVFTAGTPLYIALTPLTEIATRQAIATAGGESTVSAAQASAANSAVVPQLFGAGSSLDILTPPTLVNAAGSGSLGTGAADRYAFYLAALAHLGSGSQPALAVSNALATDLADGILDGTTSSSVSYTTANFASLIDTALDDAAGYASAALQTELGLDTGGGDTGGGDTGGGDTGGGGSGGDGTFPNENIVLPSVLRPTLGQANDIASSELASLAGNYTGSAARVTSPEGGTRTAGSCSVQVSSGGNVTLTADGVSISQNIIGTVASALVPGTVAIGGWTVEANAGAGTNMHVTRLEVNRNKLTYAHGYVVANTSQVPATFTHEIKCWTGDNRAPGTAGSGVTGNTDNQAANASNFPANTVGIYSGWVWSDNGANNATIGTGGWAPIDAGKTCSVRIDSDGKLTFNASGTALPVSNRQSQIAGDYIGGSNGDRVQVVNDAWNLLQAWDYNDAAGDDRRVIALNATTGLATLTEGTPAALKSWSCRIPTTPAPLP